jgi:hypothetical protein
MRQNMKTLMKTIGLAAIAAGLFHFYEHSPLPDNQPEQQPSICASEAQRIEAQARLMEQDRRDRGALVAGMRAKIDAQNAAEKAQWDAFGLPNPYNTGH